MQLASLAYKNGATTIFGLSYDYGYGVNDNGQIRKITDSVQPGRTVTYTYDELMRLASAVTDGSGAYPKWGLSFSYDRYGNRTAQNVTYGNAYSVLLGFEDGTHNNINRILTSSYDASGNITLDGSNAYKYDAENRLVDFGNGGATYAFDGNGLRVKRTYSSATTVYIFNGSQVIAEYASGAAPTAPTREYIYAGTLLAKIEGANTTYYYPDHLSNRVTKTGGTTAEQGHYPFGESSYGSPDKWQFTTYERDTESGNDYADFRSYVNRYGRFLTPDPAGTVAVDPLNPQSWNQYAYVLNDPIGLIDPLGLCPAPGVYSKKCVYVQRIGGGYNCSVDGVMTDCGLAFSLIGTGAAYPSSTPDGECYQVNGQIYCGTFQRAEGDRVIFNGSKFDPNAYLTSIFSTIFSTLLDVLNHPIRSSNQTIIGRFPVIIPYHSNYYPDYALCAAGTWIKDLGGSDVGTALGGSAFARTTAKALAKKAAKRTGTRAINGGGAFVGAGEWLSTVSVVFDYVFAITAFSESVKVHDQCAKQVYGGW